MDKQQCVHLQQGDRGTYLGEHYPIVIVPTDIAKQSHVNQFILGKMGKGSNSIGRSESQHG